MTKVRSFDALILGQGLAGSLLAWTLSQRGWSVCVIDDGYLSASSRAAAGLINPITGKRLAKTPEVDWLLPHAVRFYQKLEQGLGLKLLHALPLARLFRSPEDEQLAERRMADPNYRPYFGPRLAPSEAGPGVIAPLGCLVQKGTGYLDSRRLIQRMAEVLQAEGRLLRHQVTPGQIRDRGGRFSCLDVDASRVIFCQGYRAMIDPVQAWLPFQPAKGEILTLETSSLLPDRILNAGRWLLPLSEHRFKLGATYDWNHLDNQPTAEGRRELLEALPNLARLEKVQLVEHLAGVRPATLDNAPFIGRHPHRPSFWIFNGFGSKGSLQIPGYAELLADHMETGRPLPPRVDVERFADRLG